MKHKYRTYIVHFSTIGQCKLVLSRENTFFHYINLHWPSINTENFRGEFSVLMVRTNTYMYFVFTDFEKNLPMSQESFR